MGFVLLALGVGGLLGSVLSGKLSDARLVRVAAETGKPAPPEERLKGVYWAMLLSPLTFVAYGVTVEKQTRIAGPVISLAMLGFSTFWI